jgi:hypothetical protein
MKWVFFLFRRITELVIKINENKSRKILHLDAETIKVLKLMCEKYEKFMRGKNNAENRLMHLILKAHRFKRTM